MIFGILEDHGIQVFQSVLKTHKVLLIFSHPLHLSPHAQPITARKSISRFSFLTSLLNSMKIKTHMFHHFWHKKHQFHLPKKSINFSYTLKPILHQGVMGKRSHKCITVNDYRGIEFKISNYFPQLT